MLSALMVTAKTAQYSLPTVIRARCFGLRRPGREAAFESRHAFWNVRICRLVFPPADSQ